MGLPVALLLSLHAAAAADVPKLSDGTFSGFVAQGSSVILFQQGSKLWPNFAAVSTTAAIVAAKVNVGWVDCEWSKARKACASVEVSEFPSVAVFPNPADAEDFYVMPAVTTDTSASEIAAYAMTKLGAANEAGKAEAKQETKKTEAKVKKAEEAKKDHREGAKDEQKADDETKKEEEIPELPPRKDFQSPLTKPTCVDYCYNEGCPSCKRLGPLLRRMQHENPMLKIKWHNWAGDRDSVAVCNTLKIDYPDVPYQVPLIFIGNGTLGKTAWKSPKALKEYVDGAVFVSYPEKYLPKYDGVKCKSDKYILPSFKEELDKMENEAAEKRRLEREQAKSEL